MFSLPTLTPVQDGAVEVESTPAQVTWSTAMICLLDLVEL